MNDSIFFIIFLSFFFTTVNCYDSKDDSNTPQSCLMKLDLMKNFLQNLKLEQKKFGNVTIANMELFYEMCIDSTNCIDTIFIPDFLKGLVGIGTMFLKSACDEYGFNVGPYSKCIERTKFDLTTLRNTTFGSNNRRCKLTNDEFSELQKFIQEECGDEAVKDLIKNEKRVRSLLCNDSK